MSRRDEMMRRISEAMDRRGGLAGDRELTQALLDDDELRRYAEDLTRLEMNLRSWPRATRSEADWEKFAEAIEAKLDAPNGTLLETSAPPLFDDIDVHREPITKPTSRISLKPGEPLRLGERDSQNPTERIFVLTKTAKIVGVPPATRSLPPRSLPPALPAEALRRSGRPGTTLPGPPFPSPSAPPSGASRTSARPPLAPPSLPPVPPTHARGMALSLFLVAACALLIGTWAIADLSRSRMQEPAVHENHGSVATNIPPAPEPSRSIQTPPPSPAPALPRVETPSLAEEPSGADSPARESARRTPSRAKARASRPASAARPIVASQSPASVPAEAPASVPSRRVSTGSEPELPSRDEIRQSLEEIRPAVRACAGDRSGIARVHITFASNGRVQGALVEGDFAATPEGSCIARTVRRAHLSPFRQSAFSVTYPYAL